MVGFNRMWHKKGSKESAKRRGDKGHPCLVPLAIGNGFDRTPLALTLADGVSYTAAIHLIILGPKSHML